MSEDETDPGLRAANVALSGKKHSEVIRRASIELRHVDPKNGPWEAAAILSVGLAALLIVLGAWFW